ncbi:MAG: leucine-rich repeat domain-containing protein [Clostridia bacterium]|nr:leucine-rich repeat domain-containing protein [Clostridia bacterium]
MIKTKSSFLKIGLFIVLISAVIGLIGFLCMKAETASAASTSDLIFLEQSDGTYEVKAANHSISGDLVIPSTYNGKPVTALAKDAFWGCNDLTNINIPSSITTINSQAVMFCRGLTNIDIPNSVITIGSSAFDSCTGLKNITIPDSVTEIHPEAFCDCSSLEAITIPENVNIGRATFKGCEKLSLITFKGSTVQWSDLNKQSSLMVPSNATVRCLKGAIFANVDEQGTINDDVMVSFTGYQIKGYYSHNKNDYDARPRTLFNSGTVFSDEGYYVIEVQNSFTASVTYFFKIDKSAPVINSYDKYTNSPFTMSATDKYSKVDYWEVRFNSGTIQSYNSKTVTIDGGASSNGVWSIRVADDAGNVSDWVTINYAYRETFGNISDIYNSYHVPTYYVATLSQKNYPDYYGSYTFADYNSALRFTTQKEWDCRVIVMEGGKSWNYVSASNENTRQIYTERAELDTVIDKYARKNISERKIMGKNGNELSNPTDNAGVTRVDALTHQLPALPSLLSAYSNYSYMLALAGDCLEMPRGLVEGNKITATIQYLSDGISLRIGNKIELSYGTAFKDVVNEQGWYLITEQDICGNVEKYLIFIDLQQPDVLAEVEYGSCSKEIINFNQTYIDENDGAMRYVAFNFQSITDNIDEFVMLTLSGRNLDEQYLWGDELPVLNFENGYYGAYTVTAYDRSHNVISFVVYIAGASPSLKNTSLTNETACTFTVQINDSYNEITDIKLFKVYYDGTEERLFVDSFDTEIGVQNLVYKMAVGGKYIFEFTDLYGRTVRTAPIFYMKGLPTATLRGVKDGGLTKNDVSVTFNSDASAELYALRDGEWVLTELYELAQGVSSKTMRITASPAMTAVFKVLLFVTNDRNLFTEYTFEIDGIPPSVVIMTDTGEFVLPDTVTTKSFLIDWTEAGYKAYYRKAGALSDETYIKGSYIKAAGSYEFTVYDSARNELSFTVTLDNDVSFTLEGNYLVMDDGSYVTRTGFVLTLTEPWSEFNIDADNGLSVLNGQKIDIDGKYNVNVKDLYGNALTLKLIVDKTPPEPIILTEDGQIISAGTRINSAFSVLCNEEGASIVWSMGLGIKAYSGELLSDAGTYTFTITDRIGNSKEFKVIIDKNISFRVNGNYSFDENGNYVSRSWLSITLTEETSTFYVIAEDGTKYGADERVTAEGAYEVFIRDTSGNELSGLYLIIDKTPPTITLDGQLTNGATGGAVTVSFSGASEAWYSFNAGAKTAIQEEQTFVFEGTYLITATDVAGNAASAMFTIDRSVDVTPSRTLASGQIIAESVSFLFGEPVTAFLQKDGVENFYTRGSISEPGEYKLKVADEFGNEKSFSWVIVPPRAREYAIKLDGLLVAVEKDGQVYSTAVTDGYMKLDETGTYRIEFNGGISSWTLNIEVDRVTPTVEIENTGKSVKISNPNKDGITYTLYLNGEKKSFNLSKVAELTDKGNYRLVCEDELGNVSEYEFELQYMGGTTIILIIVACIFVTGAVVAIVIMRFKRKVF